jgi:HEAT repeats
MNSKRNLYASWVVGMVCLVAGASARGQTVERDTTITGPRGRSIQRQVEVQRGPGTIDRSVQIKRPGGTFDRSVQVQRTPAAGPWRGGGFLPGPGPRPWMFGPRPLIINQSAPVIGLGLAAVPLPFMNFSFGGGGGGGGGMGMGGGGGGMGMGGGPGPGGPPPGMPPPPPDQVALMTQRLQNFYPNNRKEAAYTLGHLQDPRAVPALVHTLKYDTWKDVRIASAIALGEIGGSEAAVALERDAIYDHKEEVRKAASTALERLNAKAKAAAAMSTVPPSARPPLPPASSSSPFHQSTPLDGPASESPGATSQPEPVQGELVPPPPPTPVTSGPGGQG